MARYLLIFFLNSISLCSQTLSVDYGLKAGINFNTQLNISADIESISNNINIFETRNGEHFGVFFKLNFKNYYIKPEINYTVINNTYNIPKILVQTNDIISEFKQKKIDVPVMFGYNIFSSLSIFLGPRFEFMKNANFEEFKVEDLKEDYQIGLQYGIGLKFKRFEVDLRVERGFEKNEIKFMKSTLGNKNQYITSNGKIYLLGLSFYL